MRSITWVVLIAACGGTSPVRDSMGVPDVPAAAWERMLEAEDARIATPEHLAQLRSALGSPNAFLRATAVRAIGRSEKVEHMPLIVPLLSDADPDVRTAAAHALGDVARRTGADDARRIVVDAITDGRPSGGRASGAMAETLGRLRTDSVQAHADAALLAGMLARDDGARTGVLRGLYFLARQPPARAAVGAAAAEALRVVLRDSREPRDRTLAVSVLALVRAADEEAVAAALQDSDAQVRREAAAAAATIQDTAAVRRIAGAAARDDHPAVRYEAVRVHAARLAGAACDPVAAAVHDTSLHVSLLAIDRLGSVCGRTHIARLDSIASTSGVGDWQRAAHATVSLAGVDAARARAPMRRLAGHTSAFARAYAARAAAAGRDTALLYELSRDPHANVRTIAVSGLAAVAGHAADSVYLRQLTSDESELLMAASTALEGSSAPRAAATLLDALDRVTALRRETSRDARTALLTRAAELGSASLTPRVRPYLRDFDDVIAGIAADALGTWTGTRPEPAPQPVARLPLPTFEEAAALTRVTFVLEMADGGEVALRLLPFAAPTNAARFARLARSGYFDGLTIHRVVPNFVVQGGSPGANEYSGDGPFTRDELGEPNWRGTVGLSTRGRDTGDAQFFINLIDNVRLDHEYTVFGVVSSGMDVVDRLGEGAVITRVSERAVAGY